jgi:hypothetical protein
MISVGWVLNRSQVNADKKSVMHRKGVKDTADLAVFMARTRATISAVLAYRIHIVMSIHLRYHGRQKAHACISPNTPFSSNQSNTLHMFMLTCCDDLFKSTV